MSENKSLDIAVEIMLLADRVEDGSITQEEVAKRLRAYAVEIDNEL